MLSRAAGIAERHLYVLAAGAAVLGIARPTWATKLDSQGAISYVLAMLIFVTAVSLPASEMARLRRRFGTISAGSVLGITVLPAVAYLLSRLVPTPDLRHGLLALGVAPAEVASVGLARITRSPASLAGGLLSGSVVASLLLSGPILELLSGQPVSVEGLFVRMGLAIAGPFVLGFLVRRALSGLISNPALDSNRRLDEAAAFVSSSCILALIWLVGSEVRLSRAYAVVGLAMAAFAVVSTVVGVILAKNLPPQERMAVVLPMAMRDFAIAAGIADAAFGPAASGPLALYGLMVIGSGSIFAPIFARIGHAI